MIVRQRNKARVPSHAHSVPYAAVQVSDFNHRPRRYDFSEAMSIENRYLTSLFSSRS